MVSVGHVVLSLNLPAQAPVWDPRRLLWATLGLAGAVLVAAILLTLLNRWRKREPEPPCTANEQLAEFRSLYERGELSQEEFERIRATLNEQLRREFEAQAGEPPPAPPAPSAPVPAPAPPPLAEQPPPPPGNGRA
jgi:hypothetical protein